MMTEHVRVSQGSMANFVPARVTVKTVQAVMMVLRAQESVYVQTVSMARIAQTHVIAMSLQVVMMASLVRVCAPVQKVQSHLTVPSLKYVSVRMAASVMMQASVSVLVASTVCCVKMCVTVKTVRAVMMA